MSATSLLQMRAVIAEQAREMPEDVYCVTPLSREAAETMALLDAVMDGLTNEDSGALRDLCATQVSFHHRSNVSVCAGMGHPFCCCQVCLASASI